MPKIIDLTGKKFGRWYVIDRAKEFPNNKGVMWHCRCDCGTERAVLSYNLISGKSRGCGCERKEKLKSMFATHGCSKTRLYAIYKGMHARCYNKNMPAYKYYGKRGISICEEWLSDFIKFKEWSIENGYTDGMSIDRIDVNGNYCPENCRWVTMKKQQNNKINSVFLSINDTRFTIAEWAEMLNTNKQTLYSKFQRLFEQLGLYGEKIHEIKIYTRYQ